MTESADVLNREQSGSSFEETAHLEFTESTEVSVDKIVKPEASHLGASLSQHQRSVLSYASSSTHGFKTEKLLKGFR